MSKRLKTYGGVLFYNKMRKEIHQVRPLNPPSFNARFVSMVKSENPDYTFYEDYKTNL